MGKEERNTIFKDGVNYEVKSVDRPYIWKINEKDVIYVDYEEFVFLRKEYYWDELDKTHNRCLVSGKSGRLIVCPKINKCVDCPNYYNYKTNKSDISMDLTYDDNHAIEYADPSSSIIDRLIAEEKIQAVNKAISEIKDDISRFIIECHMDDYKITDEELVVKVFQRFNVTLGRRAINKRRNKELAIIRNKVKDYFI